MSNELLAAELIFLALAWWLGLYLLARDSADLSMRFAGLGLTVYAFALAAELMREWAPDFDVARTLTTQMKLFLNKKDQV